MSRRDSDVGQIFWALAAGLAVAVLPAASARTGVKPVPVKPVPARSAPALDAGAEIAPDPAALAAAAASGAIIFGASGGSAVDALSAKVGTTVNRHSFGQLNGSVPPGRMVNMKPNVPWRSVTAAQPGSAVYTNIARWADTLKSRPGPILFVFSHEPEGKSSQGAGLGTASEFIGAFRKVRDVFTARGVRSVEYTWNMTSNAYRVPSSDARSASKWYPGDAYVDNVATAAYNWFNCREGTGQWLSLANRAAEPMAFAKAHGKKYVLAEWASAPDARRAQWLLEARQWLIANKTAIRGAFYYHSDRDCRWNLTTNAEYDAFATMARDKANFGG